jgi:transcriptional regulator with XRE-family HTH domain
MNVGHLVGREIAKERRLKGWTQEDLAEVSGYSIATIRALEGAKSLRGFRFITIDDILTALDMEWIIIVKRPCLSKGKLIERVHRAIEDRLVLKGRTRS